MRLAPPRVEDAEALTDLHLDVWEEAYADLMPASVFAERRAGRDQRAGPRRPRRRTAAARADGLYVRAEVYGGGVGHERRMVRAPA